MASALLERLDPVVSLAGPPASDDPHPPDPTFADGPSAAVAAADEVAEGPTRATTASGFPLLGLAAAVAVHVLAAAGFYVWLLHQPPEEFPSLGDAFEVILAEDKAGHVEGKADQSPDGAPTPEDQQAPNPHARATPAEPVPPAPAPTPPEPPQSPPQQSFDAMPPPAAPPVPDTADAWAPRVQPALVPPAPPTPPTPPAPPKPVARVQPAAPPSAPPVTARPTMQRSVDLRQIPGRASHRDLALGSDSGGADAVGYGMLVFRAITHVKFYPPRASERGQEGVVLLRVTIGRSGRLVDAWVARGSSYPELDAATIEMAHRASFPPLPPELGAERTFDVPIHFGIRYR